jgi:hypothetical protein
MVCGCVATDPGGPADDRRDPNVRVTQGPGTSEQWAAAQVDALHLRSSNETRDVRFVVELCRLYLFGAASKDGVEIEGNKGDLVVEVLPADRFKVLLAAPCGPFRLCDCAITGEVGCDGPSVTPR